MARTSPLPGAFQSTLPVWGATGVTWRRPRAHCDFNPRSPCGERLSGWARKSRRIGISIHAPRVGSDFAFVSIFKSFRNFNPRSPCGERPSKEGMPAVSGTFQSTLPVWGATLRGGFLLVAEVISIHAPRVGSDPTSWTSVRFHLLFQSTLPVWGATKKGIGMVCGIAPISIHAPRVGSDRRLPSLLLTPQYFNPRSPCGERPEPTR